MDPQPMGKVRDLGRLAERVACRSTVRWSRLWAFLGFCLLAAVVCGPAVDLPRAQGAGAVAGSLPSARAPTRIPQQITFDQPSDTAVGQPGRLTASSVTATTPAERTGLLVSFRSDTPDLCTVSGTTATLTAVGTCTITASQGGSDRYAAARAVPRSFQAHTGIRRQAITSNQPPDVNLGQSVTLSASTDAKEPLDVSFRSDSPMVCTVSAATVTTVAALAPPAGACADRSRCSGSRSARPGQRPEHRSGSDAHSAYRIQPRSQRYEDQGGQAMTPPQEDPPQTVLDLLFPPGEDGPTAVLSPGANEDLGRVLQDIPAALREAAVRETTNAAKGQLNVDLIGFLVSGWQKNREVIVAARRTVAAPGSIELIDLLADHGHPDDEAPQASVA